MNITEKREQSICNILEASLELFHDNGFQNTTVRQIAEKSNVALGMINHYFTNKDYLGAVALSLLNNYAVSSLPSYISIYDDPILYDYATVRILFHYLIDHGYRTFYLDSFRMTFSSNIYPAVP